MNETTKSWIRVGIIVLFNELFEAGSLSPGYFLLAQCTLRRLYVEPPLPCATRSSIGRCRVDDGGWGLVQDETTRLVRHFRPVAAVLGGSSTDDHLSC